MALLTVTVQVSPNITGGTIQVTADTFTEAKTKVGTELTNRLSTANAQAAALQNVLNAVNT